MANPEIIYNVLIKDRHCDPIIHNFKDQIVAVKFARENAKKFCRSPEDLKETHYNPNDNDGWILLIETSCEDDYVRVTEGELE